MARVDRCTVRFCHREVLAKSHGRQAPGGRASNPSDFPSDKRAYDLRDIACLKRQAEAHGAAAAVASLPPCSRGCCSGHVCGASTLRSRCERDQRS